MITICAGDKLKPTLSILKPASYICQDIKIIDIPPAETHQTKQQRDKNNKLWTCQKKSLKNQLISKWDTKNYG